MSVHATSIGVKGCVLVCIGGLNLANGIEDPKTKHLVTVPSSSPGNSYAFTDKEGKRQSTWL
jgi:hypothetical protein